MEKGGILGIPCSHAYPHIVKQEIHCLPAALKGVDMAVYEAVRALKLKTRLRPILSGDAGQLPKEYYKELWTAEKDEWRARQKEDRAKYSRRTEAMDESEDEEGKLHSSRSICSRSLLRAVQTPQRIPLFSSSSKVSRLLFRTHCANVVVRRRRSVR